MVHMMSSIINVFLHFIELARKHEGFLPKFFLAETGQQGSYSEHHYPSTKTHFFSYSTKLATSSIRTPFHSSLTTQTTNPFSVSTDTPISLYSPASSTHFQGSLLQPVRRFRYPGTHLRAWFFTKRLIVHTNCASHIVRT